MEKLETILFALGRSMRFLPRFLVRTRDNKSTILFEARSVGLYLYIMILEECIQSKLLNTTFLSNLKIKLEEKLLIG